MHTPSNYKHTSRSGNTLEGFVKEIITSRGFPCWQQIKMPTKFSEKGYTEADIIFTNGETIFVCECKNISKIVGSLEDDELILTGHLSGNDYIAHNIVRQNNLHCHALIDYYHLAYNIFPSVYPLIIVPDTCIYPTEFNNYIWKISSFSEGMSELGKGNDNSIHFNLSLLFRKGE